MTETKTYWWVTLPAVEASWRLRVATAVPFPEICCVIIASWYLLKEVGWFTRLAKGKTWGERLLWKTNVARRCYFLGSRLALDEAKLWQIFFSGSFVYQNIIGTYFLPLIGHGRISIVNLVRRIGSQGVSNCAVNLTVLLCGLMLPSFARVKYCGKLRNRRETATGREEDKGIVVEKMRFWRGAQPHNVWTQIPPCTVRVHVFPWHERWRILEA